MIDPKTLESVMGAVGTLPGGLGGALGGMQAAMGQAAMMHNAMAKMTMADSAFAACGEMNRLKAAGHFPMGAPVSDAGKWIIFYWERQGDGQPPVQ